MNKKLIKQVFDLFVAADDTEPLLTNPFEYNGYVYASDNMALIRCLIDKAGFKAKNRHIEHELSNGFNPDIKLPEINTSELMTTPISEFELFKTEQSFGDCETCDGYGSVKWVFKTWKNIDHCPACNGSGDDKSRLIEKTFPMYDWMLLKGIPFRLWNIYRVWQAGEMLGCNVELVSHSGKTKPVMFKVWPCEIAVMPFDKRLNGANGECKMILL